MVLKKLNTYSLYLLERIKNAKNLRWQYFNSLEQCFFSNLISFSYQLYLLRDTEYLLSILNKIIFKFPWWVNIHVQYITHTNYRILGKIFFFMELACFQLFKTNGLFMEMSHENHSKGGGGGKDESGTQNWVQVGFGSSIGFESGSSRVGVLCCLKCLDRMSQNSISMLRWPCLYAACLVYIILVHELTNPSKYG